MSLVEIDWRPGPRQLRMFGLSMIIGFAVFAALAEFAFGQRTLAIVFASIGGGTGALGLTGLSIALPIYWVWMSIAFVMGNIVSRVVITLFYYGMITPFGLVMWVFGRDRLQRRNKRDSYWDDVPPVQSKDSYERQF